MCWACQQPLGIHFSNLWMCTLFLLRWWRIYSRWSSGTYDSLFIPLWFLWLKIVLRICGRFGWKRFYNHCLSMLSKPLAVHGLVFYKMVEQRFQMLLAFLVDQTWKWRWWRKRFWGISLVRFVHSSLSLLLLPLTMESLLWNSLVMLVD